MRAVGGQVPGAALKPEPKRADAPLCALPRFAVVVKGEHLPGEDGVPQCDEQGVALAAPVCKVDLHPVFDRAAEKRAQFAQRVRLRCAGLRHGLQGSQNLAPLCIAQHGFAQLVCRQNGDAAIPAALCIERYTRFAQRLRIAVNRAHRDAQATGELGRSDPLALKQDVEHFKQTADLQAHSSSCRSEWIQRNISRRGLQASCAGRARAV